MKLSKSFFSTLTVAILLLAMVTACNNQRKSTENATENPKEISSSSKQLVFDKLVGTWQSEDGQIFEHWIKNADSTYSMVAFGMKNNDTSWKEQAAIYRESNQWVFENTVKGQNYGKAVKFMSTILNDTAVRFSNPTHDFPTDVHYAVADSNTVNAFIMGPNKKGYRDTIHLNYKRL